MCELLEHLDGDPAVVVAWSLAVQEVLVCSQEFGSKRIRAAVLVAFPVLTDPEVSRRLATERMTALQVDRDRWTRDFVKAIHRRPQSDAYLDSLIQAALSVPTNAAVVMIANFDVLGPTDLRPALSELSRPVLYVVGAHFADQAQMVRSAWPHVRVEVLENVGHALFVDEPQRFNRLLEEFLASLSEK